MELSIRLEAIVSMTEKTASAADVGCDHGFLSIELVRRGITGTCYACDVRKGPLSRADEHIRTAGLEEKIQTRLQDGLDTFKKGEVHTVIMAGLGGPLTVRMLESAEKSGVLESVRQLVLQPQSEWETVRRFLPKIGYRIDDEKMLLDRDKYYWIFSCHKACKDLPSSEELSSKDSRDLRWRYGTILIERKDPVLRQYLVKQLSAEKELLQALDASDTPAALKRKEELLTAVNEKKEVLSKWD